MMTGTVLLAPVSGNSSEPFGTALQSIANHLPKVSFFANRIIFVVRLAQNFGLYN